MNLVVDIGNTRAKAAVFQDENLLECFIVDELSTGWLDRIFQDFPGTGKAILSAVTGDEVIVSEYLSVRVPFFLRLTHETPVPVRNLYKTPATLGLDRLAAAIGAHTLYPGHELLVMDAGTALTMDLVGCDGTFSGGNISPGLRTRFRSLHEFTGKLPLIGESGLIPELGLSTDEAIRAGVVQGMIFEMDGMISSMMAKYPGLLPVLTGGDAAFFERRLKNHIFVHSDITLIGLNSILEYNVNRQ